MRALRLLCIPLVCAAACTEHDWENEKDRVGPGPIPDAGSACNLELDPTAELPCEIESARVTDTVSKHECDQLAIGEGPGIAMSAEMKHSPTA